MSNTDITKYPYISKNVVLDIFPIFPYIIIISTPVISDYWYLKVNFLGPENLL